MYALCLDFAGIFSNIKIKHFILIMFITLNAVSTPDKAGDSSSIVIFTFLSVWNC